MKARDKKEKRAASSLFLPGNLASNLSIYAKQTLLRVSLDLMNHRDKRVPLF